MNRVRWDKSTARAVLGVDRSARILFNESIRKKDTLLRLLASRILGFTSQWLGSRGIGSDEQDDLECYDTMQ